MPDPSPSWRDRLATIPVEPSRLLLAAVGALAVVVAGVVAVVVLRDPGPSAPLTLPPAAPGPGATGPATDGGPPATGEVYVHAAGAVGRPGVYRVRGGGRVSDVIDAAGGPAPDADLDQLNLAAKVSDGDRVLVPRRGETLPEAGVAGEGGSGAAAAAPVNVNTATAEQLEELPGVGPATAQAIVDHRRQHGRFRSVEELLDVRGIGEAKLAALRSRVRV